MSSVSLNPEMISMEIFQKAIDEILKRDKGYAFTYQDSKGYLPLRQSIVQSLAQKKDKYDTAKCADNIRGTAGNRYCSSCFIKTRRYRFCRKSDISRSDGGLFVHVEQRL